MFWRLLRRIALHSITLRGAISIKFSKSFGNGRVAIKGTRASLFPDFRVARGRKSAGASSGAGVFVFKGFGGYAGAGPKTGQLAEMQDGILFQREF
jgi:hypothetical protein